MSATSDLLQAFFTPAEREPLWREVDPAKLPLDIPVEFVLDTNVKRCDSKQSRYDDSTARIERSTDPEACELWTDGSVLDDGRGAGAATLHRPRADDVSATAIRVERIATCSFAAEMSGLLVGLRLAQSHEPNAPLRVFSDSLSALSSLQRGPLRQQSAMGDACWEVVLDLLRSCPKVTFTFVFGHCGLPRGDAVDALAKRTLGPKRDDSICQRERDPVWAADEARSHWGETLRLARVRMLSTDTMRSNLLREMGKTTPFVEEIQSLTAAQRRLLAQLRTGCCGRLGGWRHEAPDKCLVCGTTDALARKGAAIHHLFTCTGSDLANLRERLEITDEQVLFEDPTRALEYAYAYLDRAKTIREVASQPAGEADAEE